MFPLSNKELQQFGKDERLIMISKQRIQLSDLEHEIKKENNLVKKTAMFDKYIDRANKLNVAIMEYCADSLERSYLYTQNKNLERSEKYGK